MKTLSLILTACLTLGIVSSCGILGGSTASSSAQQTTSSTGTTSGQAAGVALKSLYSQYKADGKFDMSNLNNIINLASLAQNIKGLKGVTDKGAFYKDFASGLVLGSNNLVTEQNSTSVMSGLTNMANNIDLTGLQEKVSQAKETVSENVQGVSQTATSVISNASSIADSVTSILNLFKK